MIQTMGKFTAIGMREKVEDQKALVINTCGKNDTSERGEFTSWSWANPTNRIIKHPYEDIEAVSVECLWQGTKIMNGDRLTNENVAALQGNWRFGKGKRPVGAYAGKDKPLIRNVPEARRKIYLPAYHRLILHWSQDKEVMSWVERAQKWDGPVYLRDFDTGRGVDRNAPMSHAWVLAVFLNTGAMPK